MKKNKILLSSFLIIFSILIFTPKADASWTYYGYSQPYTVVSPPVSSITVTLTANPTSMTSPTDQTTLTWSTTGNPDSCTASNGWSGNKSVSGDSQVISGLSAGNHIFDITCIKSGVSNASDSSLVVVYPPASPFVTLTANPSAIPSGGTSNLSWTSSNTTSCTSADFTTRGSTSGNVNVSPSDTTTYSINCNGATSSATVSIIKINYFNPLSCVQSSSPNPKFAWNTENVSSCTINRGASNQSVGISSQISGGTLKPDGFYYYTSSLAVQGGGSTYNLQCTNGGQTVTSSNSVVNVCAPNFSLGANPSSIAFVDGTGIYTGKKIVTYSITATPMNGFNSNVSLSVNLPPMPPSTSYSFTPSNLMNYSGGGYSPITLTIFMDAADMTSTTVYSPIVIEGIGGGLTRQAIVSASANGKKRPIFKEF